MKAPATSRSIPLPLPFEGSPVEEASYFGELFLSEQPSQRRRELGQFFTPAPVARFMASLAQPGRRVHRILDPGAGSGILACAVLEALPAGAGPVHVDAYEVDRGLAQVCREVLHRSQHWLSARGVKMTFTVHEADFVRTNASCLSPSLFDTALPAPYDIAILNPPYFKLQKADPRARAAAEIVHGQPNIYALFMSIAASLLANDAVLVSITPRSFTTGDYFKSFRAHLFSQMTPEAIHLFDSRQDAFAKDEVLQENVILKARRAKPSREPEVTLTTSTGIHDLKDRRSRTVPLSAVVNLASRDLVVHIPATGADEAVLEFVRSWPERLGSLGLSVSTGPIVAFRARENLVHGEECAEGLIPLLWLQNVQPMAVRWPLPASTKPQLFRMDESSRKLAVPSANYVVMRRFSAKEDTRRLVAAPLFGHQLGEAGLGLENHLNYVYRSRGSMTAAETVGLAAILGSTLLDRYFRVSNGNTQVNAAELRALPLPSSQMIAAIGEELLASPTLLSSSDHVVLQRLGVPHSLAREI